MSLPVTRPCGQALLVGNPASRSQPRALLGSMGYVCEEADDPYTALLELCQRPLVFQAVILSLTSLYREELQVIGAIKRRFPQMEVWLAQTDGRHAAMAEAIRLGADGLLSDDGLHRIGIAVAGSELNHSTPTTETLSHDAERESEAESESSDSNESMHSESSNGDGEDHDDEVTVGEPVLSADELRALLQEQPFLPPRADEI